MTTRSNFLGRSMLKDSMKIYFAFFDFPTNFYAFLNLDLIPGIYRNLKYKRKTKSSRWAIFGPLAGRLTGCAACQPSLDRLHPWRAGSGASGRWIEAEPPPPRRALPAARGQAAATMTPGRRGNVSPWWRGGTHQAALVAEAHQTAEVAVMRRRSGRQWARPPEQEVWGRGQQRR
jgi:hypothetical protein